MPHTEQKRCFATPVLNVYVESSSAPRNSSKRSSGTIRCVIPFFVQIEQLHFSAVDGSTSTVKATAPQ